MKKIWICCIFIWSLFLCGCKRDTAVYLENSQKVYDDTQAVSENSQSTASKNSSDTKESHAAHRSDRTIMVYLCGEVVTPGVYQLPEGSRICDAVDAAGGFTEQASQDYWNLAEKMEDGQMLSFPTEKEAEERDKAAEEMGMKTSSDAGDGRVNINTADIGLLQTIPGIGETRAQAIISYREENGKFSDIEDIMKVSGIKNALFEKMRDFITVG